jgi:hypothetical protein
MKTIITLDKANQAYGFPQLNGNAHYDDIISDSGITANTISATTYYNFPIFQPQNLIASNSCAITPDNRVYIGNAEYGWGYGLWNLWASVADDNNGNVSIPINKNILSGETITICGKAYIDDSTPDTCELTTELYSHKCNLIISSPIGRNTDQFNSSGILCFNYTIDITQDLIECNDFLILGFSALSNDAASCKITYTINSKHNI